ncbi:hypothetical protein MGYG_04137 [Nannizzia gypsea CBS 118893]|uniref:Uncharacterized protein n=1 Tax=Arthroderma gypseum (strain ATCC MYA-4604 / CBS 118893) TaxID=535722 RepID=E4UV15_ARTGP|nr:hypothetical protein MGYG_04137 [Nannizzia gypsea CBS 118893]EFR01132.1 hypothetical protein MGYG_04137 [Nannizzia gypsea CBS 118893]
MSFLRRFFSKEVCAADAYPSPPSSASPPPTRKRRIEGSSESDGEAFLGDLSIYNQDYRCGGPYLVELPAITKVPSPQDPLHARWESELLGPVVEILDKNKVDYNPYCGVGPAQRASDEDVVREWHDTILISATKHNLDRSWYFACKEIRSLLEAKNMSQFNVEIIDARASVYPRAFPIDPKDPFVKQWPPLQDMIIDMLGDRHWTLLQPLLLGQPDDFLGPRTMTVSLMVRPESTSDWTDVRERMVQILDSHGLKHVAVTVHRGSVLHTLSDFRILEKRDWELPTVFGGSIGMRDSNASSGTFGGYLELQMENGTWRKYGITNYHCIRGSLLDAEKSDKIGVSPKDAQENPIFVDQPSLKYHQQSIDKYLYNVSAMESTFPYEIKELIEAGEPSVSEKNIRRYEKHQAMINSTNALVNQGIQFVHDKEHHLGSVYVSSGFRATDRQYLLNWALIEVKEKRLGRNDIPQMSDHCLPEIVKPLYDPDETYISGTAAITDGMVVFKKGNRTGFTAGQLNGTKTTTLQHWIQSKEGEWTAIRGQAYSVAPNGCPAFGDAGDSGSLVIDCDGKLAGLYLGGDRDNGWGLFIGWEDLFNDIKLMTGSNVRVPST